MSSRSDVETPPNFLRDLDAVCHFDYDPCPLHGALRGDIPDGLSRDTQWGRMNWVNPPYDDVSPWLERAYEEAIRGNASVVLVPLRPHTAYWRQLVMDRVCEIYLVFGRITFVGYERPFPMSLALLIFGDVPDLPATVDGTPIRKFVAV